MSLITLLFKSMSVEPKPRKWLYFMSVFMSLRTACRQKQQLHLCSKTLRNTLTGVQFLIKLHNKPATLLQMNTCFSGFLITVQRQKRIQNSAKHLKWRVLREYLLAFSR